MIGNTYRPKFWAERLAWRAKLKWDLVALVLGNEEDRYVALFTKHGIATLASDALKAFMKVNQQLSHADAVFKKCAFVPYAHRKA